MSKYDKKGKRVYTLAPEVKSWIEWQLTHYQEQRRQLAEYADEIMPSPVAAYGLNAGGGSGGESRPTEQVAIRLTTAPHIRYLENSVEPITRVLEKLDNTDRGLISLHYFRGTHSIEGAGMAMHIGKTGAYGRINKILYALAVEFGIVSA